MDSLKFISKMTYILAWPAAALAVVLLRERLVDMLRALKALGKGPAAQPGAGPTKAEGETNAAAPHPPDRVATPTAPPNQPDPGPEAGGGREPPEAPGSRTHPPRVRGPPCGRTE